MQLNITTDYAIRTILYLGEKDGKATTDEISENMGIPRGYLEKVLRKLKSASYVYSEPGSRGGYYLNKSLNEITLGDVIRTMENTVKINRCLENDCFCSRNAASVCAIRKFYMRTQKRLEERIFNVSLKDILEKETSKEFEVLSDEDMEEK